MNGNHKLSERVLNTSTFLGLGYKDYIAARTLLRSGMLLQGATLAATAVEKYLKATAVFRGNVLKGHLNRALINSANNYGLFRYLRRDFVEFLAKVYELRYLDNLEPGFNVVIAEQKTLAELDFLVAFIERAFKLTVSGTPHASAYKQDQVAHNPLLWDDNYILQRVKKEDFVSAKQDVFEFRLIGSRGFNEIHYRSTTVTLQSSFLLEAFRPVDQSGLSFQLAYLPLPNQTERPVSIQEASSSKSFMQ